MALWKMSLAYLQLDGIKTDETLSLRGRLILACKSSAAVSGIEIPGSSVTAL